MKLSIIIINYNTPELVYQCAESVKEHLNVFHELIIVDNGSTKKIDPKKLLKGAKYIELDHNLGFGGGNNAGATQSTGELLWFLNSDTLLVDNSIDETIKLLSNNHEIGIASPVLYNNIACTKIQPFFFARFQTLKNIIIRRNRPKNDLQGGDFFETDVVVGASLMIKKNIFDKVNGFDEKMFMFFEDDDLCYRVKKLGYKVIVCQKSRIVHLQGKSVSRNSQRKKMYYSSQNYFWGKHYGFWPTFIMRILRFPYKLLQER